MKSMSRKYSIIVVTLNNAVGLQRTLDSISRLTYTNHEVIVIDGVSSDNTVDVVNGFSSIVTTFVSEKDTGVYNAMNKGLGYANGDYVVYMNSGDVFAESGTLDIVNEYDADIILGDSTYGGVKRILKNDFTLYDLMSIGINHQSTYYRTAILKQYPFDESYHIIADLKSVVEPFVKQQCSLDYINKLLSVCEAQGMSKKHWREIFDERSRIIEDVVPQFYRKDMHRLIEIDCEMLPSLAVVSRFAAMRKPMHILARLLRFANKYTKHIPMPHF